MGLTPETFNDRVFPKLKGAVYYQDVATGETKTFLRWAQSYTLYHQNDGSLVGYARYSNALPPISLRPIDSPPGAASGPNWPPVGTLFNAESTQFDQLRKDLRSQGLDLQPTKRIPESWVVLVESELPMGFSLAGLVAPEYYSGYDADPYQQVVGGQGEAGVNMQGLGIVLRGNGQEAKDIWLEGTALDRQVEAFDDVADQARRFLNPVISHRNTGMTAGRSPLNDDGRPWLPGDLVNISRSTHDGGGLSTAHVVRVYTTQVLVVWPNDADHPKSEYPRGWFSREDKTDLIFIKHDPAWLESWNKLPIDFGSRHGAETEFENYAGYNMDGQWFTSSNPLPLYGSIAERQQEQMMMGSPPPWASQVPLPTGLTLKTSPKKSKTDLFTEMDEISLHLRRQEALAQLTGLPPL